MIPNELQPTSKHVSSTGTEDILSRIDSVIKQNKRTEWTFIICSLALFATGIACIVVALVTKNFAWSTPSVVTTALLYKPLAEIKSIRMKNIALATIPMLITQLPADKAAKEIQKLISSLYGEKK